MGIPGKKDFKKLSRHLEPAEQFNGEAKMNVTVVSEENIPPRASSDQILHCCGVC